MTQSDLAEASGVNIRTVGRLERGDTSVHPSTIKKLAKALGVEPSELVERAS